MVDKDALGSKVEEISDLRSKMRELETEKNNFLISIRNRMDWLRQAIKDGDTTGDKTKDFVIACCGFPEDEILKFFQNLEERMKKHPDKLFLFVTEEEDDVFNREKLSDLHIIRRVIHLGVMDFTKNEGLIFDPVRESVEVPVKKYVVCSSTGLTISNKSDEKRKFKIDNFESKNLENRLILNFPFKDGEYPKPEIRVGYSEIKTWFEKYAPDSLEKMIENLNRSA